MTLMLPIDCYKFFVKKYNSIRIFYWLTACLSSSKHNLITAKAMGLIFSLFNITSYLLVYCSMYNARIMDLPLSSFVSHFLLLTAQSVNSQYHNAWLPFSKHIFCGDWIDCRGVSDIALFVALCNKLNIAESEA